MHAYDYLVPLGLNCELGNHLRLEFGRIECSFLQWCAVPGNSRLTDLLADPFLIFSGDVEPIRSCNMCRCLATRILCHNRLSAARIRDSSGQYDERLVTAQIAETKDRMRHLAQKFKAVTTSNNSKLYILALEPNQLQYAPIPAAQFALNVAQALKQMAENHALLVVAETSLPDLDDLRGLEGNNLFVRTISHFAPYDRAVAVELSDQAGWAAIFAEFRQKTITKDNKVYKFDMENIITCPPILKMARIRHGTLLPDELWDMFPLEASAHAMRQSGEYDTAAYLADNPEVKNGGYDPILHFLSRGAYANRPLRHLEAQSIPTSKSIAKLDEVTNTARLNDIVSFYASNASTNAKTLPGMMSVNDRAIYFYYASQPIPGDILDLGCLIGASTTCLVEGARKGGRSDKIRVFDLFKNEAGYIKDYLTKIYGDEANSLASFRKYFNANMAEAMGMLEVYEGDLFQTGNAQTTPIGLLCIDCCKTLQLMDYVARHFFPLLIPGKSIVIQQDYNHEWLPYIHICMGLLAEYFEPLLDGERCSKVWRLARPITSAEINAILGEPGTDPAEWYGRIERNLTLLDMAVADALFPECKMALGCARAIYLKRMGWIDDSRAALKLVKKLYPKQVVRATIEQTIMG